MTVPGPEPIDHRYGTPRGWPLPLEPVAYHHFLRTPTHRWWKSLVMIAATIAAYFGLSLAVTIPAMVVDLLMGNDDLLSGQIVLTPTLFAATLIGLGLMIPASMLLQWALWRQRPRWMSSVEGGLRWGLMARCALVLIPIYVLYIGGSLFFSGWRPGPEVNSDWLVFVLLVIAFVPFQAAGEEYAVRGALTRAIGAWIPRPLVSLVVATIASGALFAAGHPNLTPGRLVGYVVIAAGFSLLVWRTGGLEAAIVGHTLNNVLIMIPTALWDDMTSALTGADGAGSAPLDVVISIVLALVSWGAVELVFRRSRYVRVGPKPGSSPGPARQAEQQPFGSVSAPSL